MFDNQFNGNNNNVTIIVYQPTIVVVNETPNQQVNKTPEPVKDKKSFWEKLKSLLGVGGTLATFITKVWPLIIVILGINSS
ncbi:MAG: hypothetical protein EOO46_17860 [Flavobacterium sp.]|nr:MAG: hypothetical protein EOO46_17860 [Flavobacterium sp.]